MEALTTALNVNEYVTKLEQQCEEKLAALHDAKYKSMRRGIEPRILAAHENFTEHADDYGRNVPKMPNPKYNWLCRLREDVCDRFNWHYRGPDKEVPNLVELRNRNKQLFRDEWKRMKSFIKGKENIENFDSGTYFRLSRYHYTEWNHLQYPIREINDSLGTLSSFRRDTGLLTDIDSDTAITLSPRDIDTLTNVAAKLGQTNEA